MLRQTGPQIRAGHAPGPAAASSIPTLPHRCTCCKCTTGAINSLFNSIALSGVAMPFDRNTEIFGEGEPADYVYKVLSGAVRTYRVLNDGRRQISAFYLPCDVFVFEPGEEHSSSAEAISQSSVLVVKRSTVLGVAEREGNVARQLWGITARGAAARRGIRQHAADQERAGARRLVPPGDGAAFLRRIRGRAADDPAGHCRLSRPDHRDGLAHPDAAARDGDHAAARLAPGCAAQPVGAEVGSTPEGAMLASVGRRIMKASDIMTRKVISIEPDASIMEAVRLMLQHRISGLPVVDTKGKLVGILSEGDLLRRQETGTP